MTTVSAGAYTSTKTRASVSISPALAVAALSSIGAGAIHAAAIGVHSEHHQAVVTFTIVAFLQIAFGVVALMYPSRLVVLAGAVANAGFFAGWVMAKTSGISFIDGLEVSEPAQFADGVAAALAAVAVIAAVIALISGLRSVHVWHSTLAISALITTLVAVPAMIAAGGHSHAAGHTHGAGATDSAAAGGHTHPAAGGTGGTGGAGGGHTHTPTVVPPKKYDPTKPIDLGGVAGVTLEEQARAENLIAVTLAELPQFADPAKAEAAGFHSIGDALTGDEHYINIKYFSDGRILDPDHPESLVYEPDGNGGKKLVAAMFMLETGQTMKDVPDLGGKLTQWHIHDNLCFTTAGTVGGLTFDGTCRPPLVSGPATPMIHVWIRPHPCGPFAALEGIGGGQIAEGETRLCDTAHGA